MQAESALGRAGLWFVIMVLAVGLAAGAADRGYALHATIIAVIAFGLMAMSAGRFDPLGRAQGFFRMPTDPGIYDDDPVRWGVIATVGWSIVGLLAGLVIALQLAFPWLNLEPYANFGRLRPLHTS